MSLTAIGETPLQNNIESLDDIVGTHSKLSLASDRAVGEKSILIDHSASGKASYTIKGESINGEKLPIITIWVKPLTDNALSFTIYNPATGSNERIRSDSSGNGYFEIGEDLYKDQWNMVYLDLRDTNGSLKEIRDFKVEIPEYGTKVLIDGVNSLPLNKTEYEYDGVGNRDEVVSNGIKMRYFYQPGTNLLDRRESNLEKVEYRYDYEGNLISQDILDKVTGEHIQFDYEYNELNQLVKIYRNGNNIDSLIADYSYDHEGLRYKKVDYITGKTTIYIYGQGTEPVYEEIYSNDDLSNPVEKNSYLFMGTKRIEKDSNGTISYYYTDHLGSTRAVDVSGEITRLDYAPFGEDFRPTSERYKYTGKEDDISTGLYYYNARYYDPAIGRFITEDPAKDGINWYVYTRNNPLSYMDPHGLNSLAAYRQDVWTVGGAMVAAPEPVTSVCGAVLIGGYEIANLATSVGPSLPMLIDGTKDTISRLFGRGGESNNPDPNKFNKGDKGISEVMSPSEAASKITNADRTGTALTKSDTFHRSASYVSESHLSGGKTFNITGGDKIQRTLLQVQGEVNDKAGIFEYIIDPNGTVSHQIFKPGGIINGIPN